MKKQFQAGFFIESVAKLFAQNADYEQLITKLSFFEVETSKDLSTSNTSIPFAIRVANNLISRGLPTLSSIFIEEYFQKTFAKTEKTVSRRGTISYDFKNQIIANDLKTNLLKAFHVIEPRISEIANFPKLSPTWENLNGGFEEDILYSFIPEYFGKYLLQTIDYQRDFRTIAKSELPEANLQAIDFTLEFPYPIHGKNGFIIEFDGDQHYDVIQRRIDNYRDEASEKTAWQTLRLSPKNFGELKTALQPLQGFLDTLYFKTLSENFANPLYNSEKGLDALQFALSPLAIARIQKTVLQFILSGNLDLNAEKWQIAVIERDVPCAYLAFEDLTQLLKTLSQLSKTPFQVPEIKLLVHNSDEFVTAKLNAKQLKSIKADEEFDSEKEYDLVLEVSVLQRNHIIGSLSTKSENFARIQTALSTTNSMSFDSFDSTDYVSFLENKEAISSLNSLIQNTFRKSELNQAQVRVLERLLHNQSCIAILPANTGKTTVFQFASLFQFAPSLVVTPTRLLLNNQVYNLKKLGIETTCIYQEAKNFRTTQTIENQTFAMTIIDEVHSISEFSHDFRLEMAGLADLIRKNYCQKISGFTSTASYNVTNDIVRELQTKNVLRLTDIERKELNFNVLNLESFNSEEDISSEKIITYSAMKRQTVLLSLLKENATNLILCPKNEVNTIVEKITTNHPSLKVGACIENNINCSTAARKYIDNETDTLVASTHFAVGFDKSNIQNVLTTILPNSVESLVQMAGRVSKDGNEGTITVLFSNQQLSISNQQAAVQRKFKVKSTTSFENSVEGLLQKNLHRQKFVGLQKEQIIANELLNSISYPIQQKINSLYQSLENQFGFDFRLELQPEFNPCELSIYKDNDNLGKIDYSFDTQTINETYSDTNFARQVLNFTDSQLKILDTQKSNYGSKILNFLIEKTTVNQTLGIAKRLEKLSIGESAELKIQFTNSSFDTLSEKVGISARNLVKSYQSGISLAEYVKKINTTENIEDVFSSLRNSFETLRMIQHFQNLGIIETYTIDYQQNTVFVRIEKKENNIYLDTFYTFMIRYVSTQKAKSNSNTITNTNFIQSLVNQYLNFYYDTIETHRWDSVKTMFELCNASSEDSSKKIKDFLFYYFTARFANGILSPNLTQDTQRFSLVNYSITKNYIEKVGHSRELWQHLRASCDRLLKKQSQHQVLQLLSAYATILLETSNIDRINNSLDTIVNCFWSLKEIENLDYKGFVNNVNHFFESMFSQEESLRQNIESLVVTKIHNYWLKQFNARFLASYKVEDEQ